MVFLYAWGSSDTCVFPRCAFFAGEIDKPVQGILQRSGRKAVNVGISLEGVYVIDLKEKVRMGGVGVGGVRTR